MKKAIRAKVSFMTKKGMVPVGDKVFTERKILDLTNATKKFKEISEYKSDLKNWILQTKNPNDVCQKIDKDFEKIQYSYGISTSDVVDIQVKLYEETIEEDTEEVSDDSDVESGYGLEPKVINKIEAFKTATEELLEVWNEVEEADRDELDKALENDKYPFTNSFDKTFEHLISWCDKAKREIQLEETIENIRQQVPEEFREYINIDKEG